MHSLQRMEASWWEMSLAFAVWCLSVVINRAGCTRHLSPPYLLPRNPPEKQGWFRMWHGLRGPHLGVDLYLALCSTFATWSLSGGCWGLGGEVAEP